ncbi:MAG: MBL fold metallo-hydrolase [Anaerolineaceae bacterium 4572_32.2]|nr:MAG: MBL fold metallo-hydrolase [Anaerolineaceae bacterium 4572_32.2]HEY72224.1 FprA family A-type flavoprotein [Thermoflexia bacterium]
MATEIFNDGVHRCIRFDDLTGEGEVQSNQFLIIHEGKGALLDPGGSKIYSALVAEMTSFLPLSKLEYIILSHQDPDVGAGLNGYLLITDAVICFPEIWTRFIPAFCTKSFTEGRVISVPDKGMRLDLNGSPLMLIPAHFLHSSGNNQVYDPVSKTLFSGDLGTSLLPPDAQYQEVSDFEAHTQYMDPFHRRYMPSEKICQRWAAMVQSLDIERIAPQHGAMFTGQAMVSQFIEWVANLRCGVDLLLEQGVYPAL